MTEVSSLPNAPVILLQAEVKKLTDQLNNQNKGIEGLLSQLDACKQTINELMNTNLILRTTVNMRDKELKSCNENSDAHKAELENLRQLIISNQHSSNTTGECHAINQE